MNELALFAGSGGGILGGKLLGWRTVCAVELDHYRAGILVRRQNEGHLPAFPVWDDVRTFDGRFWRGGVDVVSGGFPCDDISKLNAGGLGLDGLRSGLWREMARIVRDARPRYVFVENVPTLLAGRGMGGVLGDLASLGYHARWGVLGAHHVGGRHARERVWVVAWRHWESITCAHDLRSCNLCGEMWCDICGDHYADCDCVGPHNADEHGLDVVEHGDGLVAYPAGRRLEGRDDEPAQGQAAHRPVPTLVQGGPWPDVSNPRAFGSPDGVPHRMDRLKAIGDAQVPRVVAMAWAALSAGLGDPSIFSPSNHDSSS